MDVTTLNVATPGLINPGLTTLVEAVGAQPPVWADTPIRAWDRDRFERLRPFMTSMYWMEAATLNVFNVVGTQHPDYAGQTWRWLLENGKRMPRNLALHRENPGYYYAEKRKEPSMYFMSLDGAEWYVGGDGNHRTCIARFDFAFSGRALIHGVNVTDYRFDERLADLCTRLDARVRQTRMPVLIRPSTQTVSREDAPGWMLERYRPGIAVDFVDGARAGEQHVLDAASAAHFLAWLEQPGWKRWRRYRFVEAHDPATPSAIRGHKQ